MEFGRRVELGLVRLEEFNADLVLRRPAHATVTGGTGSKLQIKAGRALYLQAWQLDHRTAL